MVRPRSLLVVVLIAASTLAATGAPDARASFSGSLRRYPYLTDLVRRNVTVNWATTTSTGSGTVRWGRAGGDCATQQANASKTSITVGSTAEYQWKAHVAGLLRGKRYCYRVYAGSTDLLGSDASPVFRAQIPRRSTRFSFAVFGDWGQVDGGGNNQRQSELMSEIASSGATFAVTTGDTAYPSGSQTNYGDLVHRGADTSTIFGPSFWTKAGDHIPLFNAQGNHGMNATTLVNWPQDQATATSHGTYRMETYCCANGTSSASYPSDWYAFNAGPARFYVLEASWANSNVGNADLYENDFDAHWTASRAEYQWLQHDLETTTSPCILAAWHHPRWSSGLHGSDATFDPFWQLLAAHGADVVLSGHDHDYERFAPKQGVTEFVVGTGGRSHYPMPQTIEGSAAHDTEDFGVLELTLHDTGYDWRFHPVGTSAFTDAGSAGCSQ